ncbi:PEPxxWA-CTERM sorting domain-containing protein [Sphingomonas sp. AP4-R1]|uniref:PEPxxWA-CTERM sorting domain-containing protein n=1 Tax=Sphingomonas sp. AP4-R1 TaxID=2735134 RepID=UPI0020A37933|nr:PEPxxWA-CTERM sorting domain-containing protein [Sphingomonas sp. AP4-R1]
MAALVAAATGSAAQAVVVNYDLVIDLSKATQSGNRTTVNLPADMISLLPGDTLKGTVSFTGGSIVTLTNNTSSPGQYELVQLVFTPRPSVGNVDQAVSSVSLTGVSGNYTGDSAIQTMITTNLTASAFADLTATSFSFTGFTYRLDYYAGSARAFTPSQLTLGYTVGVSAPPPSVPEPATWAMMIGGFGAIGARLRRTRAGGLPSRAA